MWFQRLVKWPNCSADTVLVVTVVDMDFECSFEVAYVSGSDMVDKEQMGVEKPVSLIGSPMCQTLFDLFVVIQTE